MRSEWVEITSGVHVHRHPVLDVTSTLVIGDGGSLLVDTLATPAQARSLGVNPTIVVNTHHHFDHCLGNQMYPDARIWAHRGTARTLAERPGHVLAEALREFGDGHPERAGLVEARVVAPTDIVDEHVTLEVGGRVVELWYFGLAHTDGDLVVTVPDASVAVVGDLIEEGASPQFSDAYPLEWPHAVAELSRMLAEQAAPWQVVPGHGAVVDEAFVRAQHDELAAFAWLIRDGHRVGRPVEEIVRRAPFDPRFARDGVRRGYARLDGAL